MILNADLYNSVDWNRTTHDEVVAIARIVPKIVEAHYDNKREDMFQHTRLHQAFDELDFELYRAFDNHQRRGL